MNNTQTMTVYVVIGGCDYEGESLHSLKLFDCKSSALKYEEELKKGFYDYVIVREQDVIMESALSV